MSTWSSTGLQWATQCTTLSSTAGWIRGRTPFHSFWSQRILAKSSFFSLPDSALGLSTCSVGCHVSSGVHLMLKVWVVEVPPPWACQSLRGTQKRPMKETAQSCKLWLIDWKKVAAATSRTVGTASTTHIDCTHRTRAKRRRPYDKVRNGHKANPFVWNSVLRIIYLHSR